MEPRRKIIILTPLGIIQVPDFRLQTFSGDLDLCGTDVADLGPLKSVSGNLDLSGLAKLTSLGQLESVGGYLNFLGTGVADISTLKRVGGYIFIRMSQEYIVPANFDSHQFREQLNTE